jgi:hypothetical protein
MASAPVPAEEGSLSCLGYQFVLNATDNNIGLHHRVPEPKLLLSVPTTLVQNMSTLFGREAPQVLLEMSNTLLLLHDCAVGLYYVVWVVSQFEILRA